MRVLMATDGSAQATTALETAARLLRREDVDFGLLCVVPEYHSAKGRHKSGSRAETRRAEAYFSKIQEEARQVLTRAQAALAKAGVHAEGIIEIGSPARVITQAANDYDLVVVGAHDKYARSMAGIGTVASRVVASAPSTVLIGRELPEANSLRILAAVDGSLASEQALEKLKAWMRIETAEITLMHVIETPWIQLNLDREWFDYSPPEDEREASEIGYGIKSELNSGARSVIERARMILEERGIAANMVIAEGDPALEILSEVERGDYDLVVIGATGGGDLKHSMLGSVSLKVAENCPVSVLIAKEP